MDGKRPTIALNTLTSYLRYAVSITSTLILIPFILTHLGKIQYGLWTLIFSTLALFEMLDLGFGAAVVKYVAQCKGEKDPHKRNAILSTLWLAFFIMALLAGAGVAGLSLHFASLFTIPANLQNTAQHVLWILAGRLILLSLPLGLFRGVLYGEQRIYQVNLVQMVTTLLYLTSVLLTFSLGYGIITLAWLNLATMLLEHVIYAILVYKRVPDFKLSPFLAKPKMLKEVSSFSLSQFLTDLSALVLLRTDPVIVKFFLTLPAVAVYGIALNIVVQGHHLVKQFINVLTVRVAELHGEGDTTKIQSLLMKGTRIALIPATILTVSLYFLGSAGIEHWVGPNFQGSVIILYILGTALWAGTPQMVAAGVLAMTGHHRFTSRTAAFSAIVNIGLSILLIPHLGLPGVALATLLCRIGIDLLLFMRKAFDVYKISLRSYIAYCWYPALSAGLHQAAILAVAITLIPPTNLWLVIGEGSLGAITFLLVFWCYHLKADEKIEIKGRLPQMARLRN